jgi:hypothetical protein
MNFESLNSNISHLILGSFKSFHDPKEIIFHFLKFGIEHSEKFLKQFLGTYLLNFYTHSKDAKNILINFEESFFILNNYINLFYP